MDFAKLCVHTKAAERTSNALLYVVGAGSAVTKDILAESKSAVIK